MAAARRPPPVYVFNHYLLVGNGNAGEGGEGWADPYVHVGNGTLTGKAGEGWTELEIARREAYGCGDNMRQALDGVSLCVRLGDGAPLVTSTLGLRLSRDAYERFESELGVDPAYALTLDDDEGKDLMLATARIMLQDQDLLVMALSLEHDRLGKAWSCYLVYDRGDASLYMASWVPGSLSVVGMFRPVPRRTSNGGGGAYELFLLACQCDEHGRLPFLCVFSPATATGTTTTTTTTNTKQAYSVWEMRMTTRSWNVPVSVFKRFRLDATFCFQGKGFWADLSQALIYCDLPTAGDDDDAAAVDFGCIELPGECQLTLEEILSLKLPRKATTRTIACVGDSIWFVCIHRGKRHADDSVTMWSLELLPAAGGARWKNEARLAVRELWRFDGFKEAGLPEAEVGYPLLTADGALCLVVTGQFFGYSPYSPHPASVDHICTFDVRSRRLLWHGTVHDQYTFDQTVAFPPEFFQRKKHGSHKRKFDELHPAAGPGFAGGE